MAEETLSSGESLLLPPWPVEREESTLHPIAESTLRPIAESALRPITESTLRPIAESTLRPIAESTLRPIAESTLRPIAESARRHMRDSDVAVASSLMPKRDILILSLCLYGIREPIIDSVYT